MPMTVRSYGQIAAHCIPPLFSLVMIFLTLFAMLSPVPLPLHHTALLTVTTYTQNKSASGPSVWIGLFGSCAQNSSVASPNCTKSHFFPQYNSSVAILPRNAPTALFKPPPHYITGLTVVAAIFAFLFLVSVSVLSWNSSGWSSEVAILMIAITIVNFLGFTVFVVLYVWYEKTRQDFNAVVGQQSNPGGYPIASIGIGFKLIWSAYALLALPFIETIVDCREICKSRADGKPIKE